MYIYIGESDTYLTQYKKYERYYKDSRDRKYVAHEQGYYFINDRGGGILYSSYKDKFLTLIEWRSYQINKIIS